MKYIKVKGQNLEQVINYYVSGRMPLYTKKGLNNNAVKSICKSAQIEENMKLQGYGNYFKFSECVVSTPTCEGGKIWNKENKDFFDMKITGDIKTDVISIWKLAHINFEYEKFMNTCEKYSL